MKKSRFTEEQIVFAQKQAELGTSEPDVCRKLGIADATFYTWRKRYGGIFPSELKHMRQLEEENLRLKKLVADLSLDKAMLQDVLAKNELTLARLSEWGRDLQAHYGASERQVCLRCGSAAARSAIVLWPPTTAHCDCASVKSPKPGYTMVTAEFTSCSGRRAGGIIINAFTGSTASRGCPCVRWNKSAQRIQPQPQGLYPNHVWGMDFVSDALFDGRRLRLLTVIDLYTRECLGICVGQNLRAMVVAEMLNTIALKRPLRSNRRFRPMTLCIHRPTKALVLNEPIGYNKDLSKLA